MVVLATAVSSAKNPDTDSFAASLAIELATTSPAEEDGAVSSVLCGAAEREDENDAPPPKASKKN